MTEKEKRDQGLLFKSHYDAELLAEADACKDTCHAFNQLLPSQHAERRELLKKLFGSVGSIVAVQSPFWCDFGYNIHVGMNFYANHGLTILDGAPVRFGDNIFIGPNCGFHTAGHAIDSERRNAGLEFAHPITVGDNVWFGAAVQVLPGVSIGSNVVIGTGSIVTKNIPDNVVAVGNPCKVLRSITEEDTRNAHSFAQSIK